MNKKNVVIVGYGSVAPVHAGVVDGCDKTVLYGICDCDSKKLEKAAKDYDCKLFESYDDVLADPNVDSVHICTPHHLHAEMVIKAIECGKYVVVEKPAGINMDEINKLRTVCAGKEKNICAILQNRLNSGIQEMRRIINSGEYGKVLCGKVFLTWHRTPEYYAHDEWRGKWATEGGGVVVNQAVHALDMMEYVMGRFAEVEASIDNRTLSDYIEVEDTAEAFITTESGARVLFYASNGYGVSTPFDLEVQLEDAVLKYMHSKLYVIKGDEMTEITKDGRCPVPGKHYWGTGHSELLNNFYSALNGSDDYYTTITDGLDAARLVAAIYESAKTNKRVKCQ